MHKVKCPVCEVYFDRDKEPSIQYKNRWYHLSCYQTHKEKTVKEEQDKIRLTEYICKLYGIDKLSALINRQIKEYKEEKEYKYSGMLYTLVYFYEIKENKFSPERTKGIGIIPYIYEEAKNYYEETKRNQATIDKCMQIQTISSYYPVKHISIRLASDNELIEKIDIKEI